MIFVGDIPKRKRLQVNRTVLQKWSRPSDLGVIHVDLNGPPTWNLCPASRDDDVVLSRSLAMWLGLRICKHCEADLRAHGVIK